MLAAGGCAGELRGPGGDCREGREAAHRVGGGQQEAGLGAEKSQSYKSVFSPSVFFFVFS